MIQDTMEKEDKKEAGDEQVNDKKKQDEKKVYKRVRIG